MKAHSSKCLTGGLLESATELCELPAELVLLSCFPACWASCYFHWAVFSSRSAFRAWAFSRVSTFNTWNSHVCASWLSMACCSPRWAGTPLWVTWDLEILVYMVTYDPGIPLQVYIPRKFSACPWGTNLEGVHLKCICGEGGRWGDLDDLPGAGVRHMLRNRAWRSRQLFV